MGDFVYEEMKSEIREERDKCNSYNTTTGNGLGDPLNELPILIHNKQNGHKDASVLNKFRKDSDHRVMRANIVSQASKE